MILSWSSNDPLISGFGPDATVREEVHADARQHPSSLAQDPNPQESERHGTG
jgi:hypothetical protein